MTTNRLLGIIFGLEVLTAHERAYWMQPFALLYSYDPADDGPEVAVIRSFRGK